MMTHHKIGNIADHFDTNSEIQDLIVRAFGTPLIVETHTRLIARARRGRFVVIMQPTRLEEALRKHEDLMEALRRRDSVQAAAVWCRHLLQAGQTVASVLEDLYLT